MRTSVNLDEDLHQMTMAYAKARGVTLGAAIGELIRRPETTGRKVEIQRASNGFPLAPRMGRKITNAMVKQALKEDLD